MTVPFTLANIRNHISDVAYNALQKVCDDTALGLLSNSDGVKVVVNHTPSNVRLGWHCNEADEIDGIFLRIYSSNTLQAWKILKDHDHNVPWELIADANNTVLLTTMAFHVSLADRTFAPCGDTRYEEDMTFSVQAEHLKHPDQIRDFFGKNRDLLPESIREAISPPVRQAPQSVPRAAAPAHPVPQDPPKPNNDGNDPAPQRDYTYYYIGGALLLLIGAAFVAKKYFGEAKPHQA